MMPSRFAFGAADAAHAVQHERCFATLFFNDTSAGRGRLRRSFRLDEAMLRLWAQRMVSYHPSTAIFVMVTRDCDAARVLAPWLGGPWAWE